MKCTMVAGLLAGTVLASAVLAGAFGQSAANAADLGGARPVVPPQDFSPPFDRRPLHLERWTGFYLGGTLGYGFGSGRAGGQVGAFPLDLDGGLGTVLAGYNWQQQAIVLGVEADLGTGGLGTSTVTSFGVLQSELNAMGSMRARLGVLLTPTLMLYGTAGFAWANIDFRLQGGQSQSETFFGYQLGVGGEMMISDHVGLRLEYLHTDLGAERVLHNGQQNVYDPDFQTIRAGVTLKF